MFRGIARTAWMTLALTVLSLRAPAVDDGRAFRHVTLIPSGSASAVESRVAQLLAARISERGGVEVDIARDGSHTGGDPNHLRIVLGVAPRHPLLRTLCRDAHIPLPNTTDPGGEGFLLRLTGNEDGVTVLLAGVDERGVLYGAGELLRRMTDGDGWVGAPPTLDVRTAPAFRVRGLTVGQGYTMQDLTGARDWTLEEWKRVVLDYALAGANTFELGNTSQQGYDLFDFVKSYGLDTLIHLPVNSGSGPEEWRAVEAIGRTGYLCPSVPEARQALLDACDARWKELPPFDYVRFVSGDGGGCECDECRPYGAQYIRLVADKAAIVHRYSPNTKILATNQKLDNAGDQAIFDYLNDPANAPFLYAFCFGPGSNAMGWMPGRRQDHRMDLFDHPGFGPWSRYPREILHQLPASIDLIMFTDLTHWVYSQYGLMDHHLIADRNHDVPPPWGTWLYEKRPDPALAMVYNRRTFHARPGSYYRVFQETMAFTEGEVAYSEGHHDHMNQWMWQRLLWNPHQSVEAAVEEYATTWFGPEAAEPMARAIFQLEDNLSTPIADNPGIDGLCDLVREAGETMPLRKMKTNYLWRQYMQKALLDKYVQLRLRRQTALQDKVERALAKALETGRIDAALRRIDAWFAEDIETLEMRRLRAEAGQLGEESAALFGVRNVGYFNLDRDFIGFGWLQKQLGDAKAAAGDERRRILERVVRYEDPGEGGFYDDAGNPGRCPHLVYGRPFGDGGFSEANRPSQRNMAFTTDEERGVTFEYRDLDPAAEYRVRFTLVRPTYLPRYAMNHTHTTQSIHADDVCLVKDLELPSYESGFFEYDIPNEMTNDGELTLWFEKSAGVCEGPEPKLTVWRNTGGWGTLCSEVWLFRKP